MTPASYAQILRAYRSTAALGLVGLYAVLAPFGYAMFTGLSMLPSRDPRRRALLLQAIVRRAFASMHDVLRVTRVLDFNPHAVRVALPDGPCVVIANHPALTDVTAILSVVPRLCTAVKPAVFRKPWLRPLLMGAGQFAAGPPNLLGEQRTLERARRRLETGFRVLVFPEGTRSPPGGLRAFGRSAFELACRANVPIIPILIRAEPVWLAKGDRILRPPAALPRTRLEALEPLRPAEFGRDSRDMRDYAQSMYRRLLGVDPRDSPSAPHHSPR